MKPNVLVLGGALGAAAFCIAFSGAADPPTAAPPAPRPAADLIDGFDRAMQKRFHDISSKDIEEGRLGVRRVVNWRSIHGIVFRPETPMESRAVDQLRAAGWTPTLYVTNLPLDPTMPLRIDGPILTADRASGLPDLSRDVTALARRAGREAAQGSAPGVALEARPVVASKSMCLGCHRGKSLGDPLGVVVYAFGAGSR